MTFDKKLLIDLKESNFKNKNMDRFKGPTKV